MAREYTHVSALGEGAYGRVWKCVEQGTDRVVAVKEFKDLTRPEAKKLAVREIKILQSLDHPAIIPLLDAFRTGSGRVYLVFPYMSRSAYHALDEHPDGLPAHQLKLLAWQLLQALGYMHARKVAHRDIKPSNILMSDGDEVRLCDFGFARSVDCAPREAQILTPYVMTRWYRAPEVLLGAEYGPSADVWSLGCTLAELATGMPLFQGASTLDQLWRILRCFGSLPPAQSARAANDPRLRPLRTLPLGGRCLRQRLPACEPGLVQLLEACLQPDPARRCTAEQLLQSPYFWAVPRLIAGTQLEETYGGKKATAVRLPVQAAAAPAVQQGVQDEEERYRGDKAGLSRRKVLLPAEAEAAAEGAIEAQRETVQGVAEEQEDHTTVSTLLPLPPTPPPLVQQQLQQDARHEDVGKDAGARHGQESQQHQTQLRAQFAAVIGVRASSPSHGSSEGCVGIGGGGGGLPRHDSPGTTAWATAAEPTALGSAPSLRQYVHAQVNGPGNCDGECRIGGVEPPPAHALQAAPASRLLDTADPPAGAFIASTGLRPPDRMVAGPPGNNVAAAVASAAVTAAAGTIFTPTEDTRSACAGTGISDTPSCTMTGFDTFSLGTGGGLSVWSLLTSGLTLPQHAHASAHEHASPTAAPLLPAFASCGAAEPPPNACSQALAPVAADAPQAAAASVTATLKSSAVSCLTASLNHLECRDTATLIAGKPPSPCALSAALLQDDGGPPAPLPPHRQHAASAVASAAAAITGAAAVARGASPGVPWLGRELSSGCACSYTAPPAVIAMDVLALAGATRGPAAATVHASPPPPTPLPIGPGKISSATAGSAPSFLLHSSHEAPRDPPRRALTGSLLLPGASCSPEPGSLPRWFAPLAAAAGAAVVADGELLDAIVRRSSNQASGGANATVPRRVGASSSGGGAAPAADRKPSRFRFMSTPAKATPSVSEGGVSPWAAGREARGRLRDADTSMHGGIARQQGAKSLQIDSSVRSGTAHTPSPSAKGRGWLTTPSSPAAATPRMGVSVEGGGALEAGQTHRAGASSERARDSNIGGGVGRMANGVSRERGAWGIPQEAWGAGGEARSGVLARLLQSLKRAALRTRGLGREARTQP